MVTWVLHHSIYLQLKSFDAYVMITQTNIDNAQVWKYEATTVWDIDVEIDIDINIWSDTKL